MSSRGSSLGALSLELVLLVAPCSVIFDVIVTHSAIEETQERLRKTKFRTLVVSRGGVITCQLGSQGSARFWPWFRSQD